MTPILPSCALRERDRSNGTLHDADAHPQVRPDVASLYWLRVRIRPRPNLACPAQEISHTARIAHGTSLHLGVPQGTPPRS